MTDTNELLALLLRETVHQCQDARAQLHADDQRAWEALGKPEGTHDTTNVQRLCAEVERLRAKLRRMSKWHDEIADSLRAEVERLCADLREAMELLRAHGHPPNWLNLGEAADWNTRYGKLLAKHKETP